jgi:hypothetical protein
MMLAIFLHCLPISPKTYKNEKNTTHTKERNAWEAINEIERL